METRRAPTISSATPPPAPACHALDTRAVQLLAVPDAHLLDDDGRAHRDPWRARLLRRPGRLHVRRLGAGPGRLRRGRSRARPRTTPRPRPTTSRPSRRYAAQFQAAKVYGALYAPWILVADPVGAGPAPMRFVPPDGPRHGRLRPHRAGARHLQGARRRRGHGARRAGRAAGFSDGQHTDLVQDGRVNGIRATARRTGIVVAASRTLSHRHPLAGSSTSGCCSTSSRRRCATACASSGRSRTPRRCAATVRLNVGHAVPAGAVAAGRVRLRPAGRRSSPSSATPRTTRRPRSTWATSGSRSTSTRSARPRRS